MSSENRHTLPEYLFDVTESANLQRIQQTAIRALRDSDFDFAIKAMEQGNISLPKLIEDFTSVRLKIIQKL